jgi:hypothetical protein
VVSNLIIRLSKALRAQVFVAIPLPSPFNIVFTAIRRATVSVSQSLKRQFR